MIVKENDLLIEVFADEGKLLDLGENVVTEYACLPKDYNVNCISEIDKTDNYSEDEQMKGRIVNNEEIILDKIINILESDTQSDEMDSIADEIINILEN